MKRRKIISYTLLMAIVAIGRLAGNEGTLSSYTSKELCVFARDFVDLLSRDRLELVSGLRRLKEQASPAMQPVIRDLIEVCETGGMDACISDFGRRIKMGATKGSVCREDLISVTERLDRRFIINDQNYHKAMIEARANENYDQALYFYLKISENVCPDQSLERKGTYHPHMK